ncbi:alpha-L-arabinofuranosidase C-terminal domain-containing protein [Bifidobacterium aerophilum]|nr:alpha-L-arabinofuranosidase C-terminal domain-containing protein [Bifidobacterium aerophilum]
MTDLIQVRSVGEPYPISEKLWGVFFEDLNYAADGGLAGDLVQNGAFEYSHSDNPKWSPFTAWRKDVPDGSRGSFWIETDDCVAEENPHHAVVQVDCGAVSLVNRGFEGMRLRAGESYELSLWLWSCDDGPHDVTVSLVDETAPAGNHDGRPAGSSDSIIPSDKTFSEPFAESSGNVSATLRSGSSVRLVAEPSRWTKVEATLIAPFDTRNGSLSITFTGPSRTAVDFVSLEPARTWHGLKHFRVDLAKTIADLNPRFVRFPGGCLVHGLGLDNMYQWKGTIGPVEHRRHDFNLWGYHQSMRLGFYEYLCWCEALGAEPIPVLPAGVSCSGTDGGSMALSETQMRTYVQDVLDFVEFCNGDAETTVWGAKRAACGHPKPFGLRYLGLGNEDDITDDFAERFLTLFRALADKHPEITVIGTAGPTLVGATFDEAWDLARAARVRILDEHSYLAPAWWFQHLDYYDGLDRNGPHVYFGEYASHGTTMLNALSEAAFMAHLEANGDVVDMASYAPLLCRNGHAGWNPDLIYFDDDRTYRTYSYWTQHMFANTAATRARRVDVDGPRTYMRELPGWTGLAFGGDPAVRFENIRIELPDGRVLSADDVTKATGGTARTDLHVNADDYRIRLRARYLDESGMFSIEFGALDEPDRYRLWIGMAGLDCALGALRDGFPYDYDRVSMSRRVSYGDEWDIVIDVRDRGRSVRATVGDTVLAGTDPGAETRRTVTVADDSVRGVTYVRMVNALPDAMDVDLSEVLSAIGLGGQAVDAMMTVLRSDSADAGRPYEAAPSEPESSRIAVPASGVVRVPGWSFTILEIPCADGIRGGDAAAEE